MDYHSVVLDIRKMKRQDNVTVGITFSKSHCNVLRYKCILSLQGKMIICVSLHINKQSLCHRYLYMHSMYILIIFFKNVYLL